MEGRDGQIEPPQRQTLDPLSRFTVFLKETLSFLPSNKSCSAQQKAIFLWKEKIRCRPFLLNLYVEEIFINPESGGRIPVKSPVILIRHEGQNDAHAPERESSARMSL
jgi:hypothetical protein